MPALRSDPLAGPAMAGAQLAGGICWNAHTKSKRTASAGFTLIEATITVMVIGIMAALAVPRFAKVFEQYRVDRAASTLRIVWTGQRLYWLKHRRFAATLSDLEKAGVLDENLVKASSEISYEISDADANAFLAIAVRINSGRWHGTLSINEQGLISGDVKDSDGSALTPTSP
jgi:competence protein ComGC